MSNAEEGLDREVAQGGEWKEEEEGDGQVNSAVGSLGATDHVLLEHQGEPSNPAKPMDTNCFLCSLRGVSLKTIYSCVQCQKGYRPTRGVIHWYTVAICISHVAKLYGFLRKTRKVSFFCNVTT